MNKKIIVGLIILLLITGIIALPIKAANVPVQGVSIDKKSINLNIGQTAQLQAIITPSNATNKNIRWSSSNNNVVTVNASGQVKALSKGIVTITVMTDDRGYRDTCTINVSSSYNVSSEKYEITTIQSVLGENVNYIKRISPQTSLEDFRKNITTYGNIRVFDLSNKEISNQDIIATGMKMQLDDGNTYVLSTTADINSDGKASILDLSRLKAYYVKLSTLDEPQEQAADINYDGSISIIDLSQMKQILVGLKTI